MPLTLPLRTEKCICERNLTGAGAMAGNSVRAAGVSAFAAAPELEGASGCVAVVVAGAFKVKVLLGAAAANDSSPWSEGIPARRNLPCLSSCNALDQREDLTCRHQDLTSVQQKL